jgi:hypothetical protein
MPLDPVPHSRFTRRWLFDCNRLVCFAIGVTLAINTANDLINPPNKHLGPQEDWIPIMVAAMLLLGSFLLLPRKPPS